VLDRCVDLRQLRLEIGRASVELGDKYGKFTEDVRIDDRARE